jgi:transketolase
MRDVFSNTIYKNIKKNKNIYLIAADISPSGDINKLKKNNQNFINVGVAEQVMIGSAAGLALSGKRVFVYTIATFALYRPFEMIRVDLCYQKLPVTIVGMGAGTVYANLGGTHTAIEDISVARSIPEMQILSPCDPLELIQCVNFCSFKSKKTTYLRIGKSGEPNLTYNACEKWKFGKIRNVVKGKKVAFLVHGPIAKLAFDVNKKFNNKYSIYSCHTLSPFDYIRAKKIINSYDKIVTIEDHIQSGGLGEIIKSISGDMHGKIINFSLKKKFFNIFSSQDDLLKKHNITVKKIYEKVRI